MGHSDTGPGHFRRKPVVDSVLFVGGGYYAGSESVADEPEDAREPIFCSSSVCACFT